MKRIPIAGAVLLVVLGTGLLIRVKNRAEVSPNNPACPPLEIGAERTLAVIETVDLTNGNLHLSIPIRAARQKTAVPRSGH